MYTAARLQNYDEETSRSGALDTAMQRGARGTSAIQYGVETTTLLVRFYYTT